MNKLCRLFGHRMVFSEPGNAAGPTHCKRKNCTHTKPRLTWPRPEERKITRVEVIDEYGRNYVNWDKNNLVEIFIQDEGRTLKIFIKKRER